MKNFLLMYFFSFLMGNSLELHYVAFLNVAIYDK